MTESLHIISDFNCEILGRYLANSEEPPVCSIKTAPFNAVVQSLLTTPLGEIAVVWARAESILPTFRKALNMEHVVHDDVLHEVDHFARLLTNFSANTRYVFVASWALPPGRRGYGLLDFRTNTGLANLIARMNLRLAEQLGQVGNIYILDSERWHHAAGPRSISNKMWLAAKVPYSNSMFQEAAADIKASLLALSGKSRRLVVVDLDDTLWGGLVGESGQSGIVLGGHSIQGEAFKEFQVALKCLSNRGIQLAIVSKNDENVALATFDNHPEMVLRRSDLAGWRINWQDKARNIAALAKELNLGLASLIFIDDNPMERGRVREALPDVLVPDWPSDPAEYASTLLSLRCFDTPTISVEDRARGRMYEVERERRSALTEVGSIDDWLKTLSITVSIHSLTKENLSRVAQLFNKTNQMNLRTRRLAEKEILAWSNESKHFLFAISVSDRFGDSGLTGILGLELAVGKAHVTDFVLSCRVMGRKVEHAMMHIAVEVARKYGSPEVVAEFIPTERNSPCLNFLRQSGFTEEKGYSFRWHVNKPYILPDFIKLHFETPISRE